MAKCSTGWLLFFIIALVLFWLAYENKEEFDGGWRPRWGYRPRRWWRRGGRWPNRFWRWLPWYSSDYPRYSYSGYPYYWSTFPYGGVSQYYNY